MFTLVKCALVYACPQRSQFMGNDYADDVIACFYASNLYITRNSFKMDPWKCLGSVHFVHKPRAILVLLMPLPSGVSFVILLHP